MLYSKEEKQIIKQKWENVYVINCTKCNGEGFINSQQCDCIKKAIKYYKLELANIPMKNIMITKDELKNYTDYDFDDYINIVLNEIFKIKNIFLCNLGIKQTNDIIAYISKKLINKENKLTKKKITVFYSMYDKLIQLSLGSNNDKNNKNQLNNIINKTDILFIDNIGLETGFGSNTKHNVKLLQTILQERSNKLKSTIISSKLHLDDINKYYNNDIAEILSDYDLIRGGDNGLYN